MDHSYYTRALVNVSKYATLLVAFLLVNFKLLAQTVSCNQEINLSLGSDCTSTLLPSDVLTLDNPPGTYSLEVTTPTGIVVPGNLVTSDYLQMTLTARVTNAANNSCWANILVEDKLGPEIQCSNVTVSCADNSSHIPAAIDACSGTASVSLLLENIEPVPCDPNILQTISQTYVATDALGNTSTCSQVISLDRIDLNTIVFPDSLLISNNTNLTCLDMSDPQGSPNAMVAGVPTFNGIPLYPVDQLVSCNITVEFSDRTLFDFGCSRKIFRTWQVYEWVCGDLNSTNFVQVIEIGDTEIPTVSCPEPISVSTSSGQCSSFVTLPLPVTSDDCTSVVETDIRYEGGFVNNATIAPVVELSGSSVVTYTVYDGCDNSATCSTIVTVEDNASPVALCDQNSVVSLRSDGTAIALTSTFDNGSFDDCQFYRTVIRRDNTNCGCDEPVFEDMNLLGQYNGHYYYLSTFRYTASTAANIANGLGGELLSINSQQESAFVNNAISSISDSLYIGLTLDNASNTFVWPNNIPLTFNQWLPGQFDVDGLPLQSGGNVFILNSGYWVITPGLDLRRFILEVDGPCGFSDRVRFCCEDVTNPQVVTLRAIDLSGTFTECTANVIVQDKFAPQISCPADVTVACGSDFDPSDSVTFGMATASDQCVSDNIASAIQSNLDPTCGTGTITKTFTASDDSGFSSCVQTFTVMSVSGFDPAMIDFPDDLDIDSGCGTLGLQPDDLPAVNAYPVFSTGVCDNVSMSFDDQIFSFSGPQSDACAKILRTWEVANNCIPLEPGVNPVIHQQTIAVNNTTAPTISGCENLSVGTVNCTNGTVQFTISALDDCLPSTNVTGTVSLDVGANGTIDNTFNNGVNSITVNEVLPLGQHIAIASFTDPCGNTSSCSKTIFVNDVSQANLLCKSSVSVNIQPMDLDNDPTTPRENMVRVWASALIESSNNGCGGALTPAFSNTTLSDNARFFDCDFVNTVQSLEVFVITATGQVSSCVGSVFIQDNNNLCETPVTTSGGGLSAIVGCDEQVIERDCSENGQRVNLEFDYFNNSCTRSQSTDVITVVDFHSDGVIDIRDEVIIDNEKYDYNFPTPNGNHLIVMSFTNECDEVTTCQKNITVTCPSQAQNATILGAVNTVDGRGISDVLVSLEASQQNEVMTDVSGNYAFATMPLGGSYNIVPLKDIDYGNGVNTVDLIRIQRHILGLARFDSPYQYIAADIDQSGRIDGRDLIELRKFILGIYDDFPLNTSWRMLDATFVFEDDSDPLRQAFEDSYVVYNLREDMEVDFLGVKIGDVDNSVSLFTDSNKIEQRSKERIVLESDDIWLNEGEESEIKLTMPELVSLEGLQGVVDFAISDLLIVEAKLENQLSSGQVYIDQDKGKIAYCWHSTDAINIEGEVLTFKVTAKTSGWLSKMISVDNSRISSEGYAADNLYSIELRLRSPLNKKVRLYPNIPNPWTELTQINFYLPVEQPITLSIYDVHGKLIYQEQKVGLQGDNQTTLMKDDLINTGLFYYELKTQKERFIHKMVLVD